MRQGRPRGQELCAKQSVNNSFPLFLMRWNWINAWRTPQRCIVVEERCRTSWLVRRYAFDNWLTSCVLPLSAGELAGLHGGAGAPRPAGPPASAQASHEEAVDRVGQSAADRPLELHMRAPESTVLAIVSTQCVATMQRLKKPYWIHFMVLGWNKGCDRGGERKREGKRDGGRVPGAFLVT